MSETPIAAAPAAPAAAPAAPVAPAPAAAPAAPVAAPAAPAAAPTAPVVADVTSLLDGAPVAPTTPAAPVAPPAISLEDAQKVVEAAKLAAQPNSGKAWNLNDTTPGQGEKPAWFKSDKYVSVAKQAEAYVELEKRFGSFTGAPRNEKGEVAYKLPEAVIKPDHPILKEFQKAAAEMQLNQTGFDKLIGMLSQYEALQQPNPAAAKAALGADADARISNVATWARANLDPQSFELMRSVTSGHQAAAAFMVLEKMIEKTGQVRMPKPGADTAPLAANGKEALVALQAAKNEKGQRKYDVDPAYRREVESKWAEFYKANPVIRDRQGNVRG